MMINQPRGAGSGLRSSLEAPTRLLMSPADLKAQRPQSHRTGRQGAASLPSSFAPALLGPQGPSPSSPPPLGFILFPLVSRQHTRVS